jgi:hAT family C-terminal dimerisation region
VLVLEPFALQTDMLQTDFMSLSSIVPSLLNLECHLEQSTASRSLITPMLRDFKRRFEYIFLPTTDLFNPVPAAATLLDPTVCAVVLTPDMSSLLHAAKLFIVSLAENNAALPTVVQQSSDSTNLESGTGTGTDSAASAPSALKKFKYLASRMTEQSTTLSTGTNIETVLGQLHRYISDVCQCDNSTVAPLEFWHERKATYSKLYEIAEDLITAPASQAYVERIFSLCGLLSGGRRNRMNSSTLEMRSFLKLNLCIQ